MSYNSKYTGSEVEAKLDSIANKQDNIADLATIRAGALLGATALQSVPSEYVTETELANKGYATASSVTSGLAGKVNVITGKGLSTNDYTTDEKNKLSGIASGAEVNVQSDWNVSDSASDAYIKNKPTIPTIPSALKNPYSLAFGSKSYDGSSAQTIAEADIVSDIATIRSGASKGATALQSYTEKYTGTVTGVKINGTTKSPASGIVDLGTVITEHQDISGKADKISLAAVATSGKYSDLSGLPTIPTSMAWTAITGKPTFATVATSGSYNDLSNKPTIPTNTNQLTNGAGFITGITSSMVTTALGYTPPTTNTTYSDATTSASGLMSASDKTKLNGIASGATAVSESTVSGWGFTKNTGTYSKPSGGIPKSDLDSSVQTSLGKADTAIQNANYPVVSIAASTTSQTLTPNTYYKRASSASSLTLGFASPSNNNIINEYVIEVVCGGDVALTLPSSVVWANGATPDMSSGKTVVISVINNLAVFAEF